MLARDGPVEAKPGKGGGGELGFRPG
jgi:hypothetical protein